MILDTFSERDGKSRILRNADFTTKMPSHDDNDLVPGCSSGVRMKHMSFADKRSMKSAGSKKE